jgi:hypothetical protein
MKQHKYKHIALFAEGDNDSQMVGTVFRKQIAKFGKWVNPLFPIEFMELDEAWAKDIKKNFDAKVIDHVPVPLDHTDMTEANTGELIKLEIVPGDGLYGYLDIRRPQTVEDINNGLIFDVSISFDWDYVDTAEGKKHGPTLLHVALVNNPYLKGMPSFEEAQVGSYSEQWGKLQTALSLPKSDSVIMLSESKVKELQAMETATVKNDKEYAVEITVKNEDGEEVKKTLAAGEETEVPKEQAEAVLEQITTAVDPDADDGKGDDDGDEDGDEGKGGDENDDKSNLSETERKELEDLRKKQALSEVESMYNTLLSNNKIVPAQKEKFMALAELHTTTVQLSGKPVSLSRLVTGILEAGANVSKFSEDGSGKDGEDDQNDEEDTDKKPSELLSDEERKGMQATGADLKKMDELAEKYPAMKSALVNDNKEGK